MKKEDAYMLEKFRPDIYQNSIYDIPYKKLKRRGIKCLLFDLDNTIASLNTLEPDSKFLDFIYKLQDEGFKIIILSNASKARVTPFKEQANIDSSYHSMKPLKKKYQKIMKLYHYKDTDIACIGDQLLTDVLGANRMGITSILVNPISNDDHILTKIARFFEKRIFKKLKKKGLLEKGVYYD